MLALFPVLVVLLSAAVFAVIAIRSRKSASALTGTTIVPARTEAETRALVRATRRRMYFSILAGILVAVAVSALPIDHVGTALVLAPGIGAAFGLLVIVVSPFPRRAPVDFGARNSRRAGLRHSGRAGASSFRSS